MRSYKASRFNFYYPKGPDNTVVFNTFTKGCASLDDDTLRRLGNGGAGCSSNVLENLISYGILVDEEFDEIGYLRYHNHKVRYASNYVSITIAPTLSCNFNCPYCFENRRPGAMSEEVKQLALGFIDSKLTPGVEKLEMTWYGGEPLLQFSIIKAMCEQITEWCDRRGIECKMGIITNGYLLTEEIVETLEVFGISVQITLDGLRENHDKRRYLANGGATFDRIFDNLKLFNGRNVDLYIRMNVDSENRPDYELLCQKVSNLNNPRAIVYPSVTEDVNERIESRQELYLDNDEYNFFVAESRRRGLFDERVKDVPISNDVSEIPDNRSYFCAAELDNSYVIDELGNVYKCWNEIGREHPCFNLRDVDEIDYPSLLNYMGDDPFDDAQCVECEFLPICFGGCKYHKVNFKRHFCAYTSESIRAYIDDVILGYEEGGAS